MKILADASLGDLRPLFSPAFTLSYFDRLHAVPDLLPSQDILLCRSTLSVTPSLLRNSSLQCIATASSGTDHVDTGYLASENIHLIHAKGINASAVADYVVAMLVVSAAFVSFNGKKAGVIGVGYVGSKVITRLQALGFDVFWYDPLTAGTNSACRVGLDDLLDCDVLCIHANLHDMPPYPSRNLLGERFLTRLKPQTMIINAARGHIVDESALLACRQPLTYCTDVYSQEPGINPHIVDFSFQCTPHIAGHTVEAKRDVLHHVCKQIHQHFEVPYPGIDSPTIPLATPACLDWQAFVLSVYNPSVETKMLHSAHDKQQAFLKQRTLHHRHSLAAYDLSLFPEALGMLSDPIVP